MADSTSFDGTGFDEVGDLPGSSVSPPDHVGGPDAAYQALLARDVLGFQACAACASAVFPPRGRCSACGADALQWRASTGAGTVYSSTVLTPREKPAYSVVLVDLDEGFRMMSRVDDASVAIDDRVTVRFSQDGERVLPFFDTTEVAP